MGSYFAGERDGSGAFEDRGAVWVGFLFIWSVVEVVLEVELLDEADGGQIEVVVGVHA